MTHSLTVVICTKDREHTLLECVRYATLSAAAAKELEPVHILIIDDGNLSEEYLQQLKSITDRMRVPLTCIKKSYEHQKGLYGSRRLATNTVATSHLLFIDDDCMLGRNYIQQAIKIIHDNDCVVGVSGVDKRNLTRPTALQAIFWRLFLLSKGNSGKLSRTGFNHSHSYWVTKNDIFESDFVHGCNMLFRTDALRGLPECSWLEGHATCEDLVLAHTAQKHGRILIGPNLEFEHLETIGGRGNALKRLQRKIRNHFNFSRMKNGSGTSDVLFAWSVFGALLQAVIKIVMAKIGFAAHLKS